MPIARHHETTRGFDDEFTVTGSGLQKSRS